MLGNAGPVWRAGTLGGAETFAGQATQVAVGRYQQLGHIQYYPTMDAVWSAIFSGEIDIGILTAETTRTGFTETAKKLLDPATSCYVLGEVIVPYRCALLGKPGARLEQIELVLGHGSIRQCERFLTSTVPSARVKVHEQNSLAAAGEVMKADGTVAVVGTRQAGQKSGLEVLAADIDDGSEGTWWLMSRQLFIGEQADRVIVRINSGDHGLLCRLLARMEAFGLLPRSMATVGQGTLFGYGNLIVFAGGPLPVPAIKVLEGLAGCELLGAFLSHDRRLPAVAASGTPKQTGAIASAGSTA